jgi:dienelactone hydrolase
MELIQSREKFTCNDGFSMSAYISRPNASPGVPGILFIYEAFGMNEEMIRIADELAAEGYVIMLPNHEGSESRQGAGSPGFDPGPELAGPTGLCGAGKLQSWDSVWEAGLRSCSARQVCSR